MTSHFVGEIRKQHSLSRKGDAAERGGGALLHGGQISILHRQFINVCKIHPFLSP